ncbi:MAG TPA: PQQ-binding-like beta-propeller repeat protein [Bryobacteraceae bacterium]|nr:PQQ-binding-like beta-propeller repeat protein [Bryobacteraceae bacterium]
MADNHDWSGWGRDSANTRFQPAPGLTADAVPKLKLKWAFGFPNESMAASQPAVLGEHIFVGSSPGVVYALHASSGCRYWTYSAGAGVRTALSVAKLPSGRWAVFFGDLHAWVHAVDAESGELLWKVKADDHPAARITGSPSLRAGRLYVPVSSVEEALAQSPKYSCCTFRGSVVALDASTGHRIWQSYTVPTPAKPLGESRSGAQLFGPAGAAVWSAPTIDQRRNLLYVATGNSYTGAEIRTSDAVLAFDLETGRLEWSAQLQPGDNFIVGCPFHPNCPEPPGADFDLGASPVLRTMADGRRILLTGQKSGMVYGLDPDDRGKVLWKVRLGEGGMLGGIMWGLAADEQSVYCAVSDRLLGKAGGAGIYAIDMATGAKKWSVPAPPANGNPAQAAAVTAIPGIVFSGAVNGHLRAYSSATGQIVWDFDTNRAFQTVNGVAAKGGSIDGPGPVVAHGLVLTNSGYALSGGNGGNVLLAFSAESK